MGYTKSRNDSDVENDNKGEISEQRTQHLRLSVAIYPVKNLKVKNKKVGEATKENGNDIINDM